MKQNQVFLILTILIVTNVYAFSDGTLIPPFICNLQLQALGAPKSLSEVIPRLTEDDSKSRIAGYHKDTVAPYDAQDLCTVRQAVRGIKATNKFAVLTKGRENLLGLVVWVQAKGPKGQPVNIGKITSPGKNMVRYPYGGCGETIVHKKPLDDDAAIKFQSGAFTWVPPAGFKAPFIVVRGVCVTAKGFGTFAVRFNTNGSPAPAPGTPVLAQSAAGKWVICTDSQIIFWIENGKRYTPGHKCPSNPNIFLFKNGKELPVLTDCKAFKHMGCKSCRTDRMFPNKFAC